MSPPTRRVSVRRIRNSRSAAVRDEVVVEEPLEMLVRHGPRHARTTSSLGFTMRTPGNDLQLVLGALLSEGVARSPSDIDGVAASKDDENVVIADLSPGLSFDPDTAHRHGVKTSACGVCGRASLEALSLRGLPTPTPGEPKWSVRLVTPLPDQLRKTQRVFRRTGGLHAAGLVDARGKLGIVREDVGRHNAVDKVFGNQFAAGNLPLSSSMLLVSGRASYEIVQKAAVAGVAAVAAVGAPSSLAIDIAEAFGLTLVGFLQRAGMNVYAHGDRLFGGG